MLPNVARAFARWTEPVVVKTVTVTTVDFVETETVTAQTVQAMVQPTQQTTLNADILDWSQPHITLHSTTPLQLGQVVEHNGADYKIVDRDDWTAYGYCKAIAQATRRPVLQP